MAAPPSRPRPPPSYDSPVNSAQEVGLSFTAGRMQNLQIDPYPPLSGSIAFDRPSSSLSGSTTSPFPVQTSVAFTGLFHGTPGNEASRFPVRGETTTTTGLSMHRTSNLPQEVLVRAHINTGSPISPLLQSVGSFPVSTPINRSPMISASKTSSESFFTARQQFRASVPASRPFYGPQAPQTITSLSPPFPGNPSSKPSGYPDLTAPRVFSDTSCSVPFGHTPESPTFSPLLQSPSSPGTPTSRQIFFGSQPLPRIYGIANHPIHPDTSNTVIQLPSSASQGSSLLMVDPDHIPRPMPCSSTILFEACPGSLDSIPPPTSSNFIVKDNGNCSPRLMRCNVTQIPCSNELRLRSNMPLALIVQPFALPHPSEEPIQIVDFGESGPIRCSRCNGYINPFMKFIDQGRSFICNLCGCTNTTPRDYYCNLGPDGRRHDVDDRPELCKGSVEFVATGEFMVQEPMLAVFFFLIDVSLNAVKTGAVASACSAVSQAIVDLPEGPRTMVGIATFDSTIHFYNLKRNTQQPLMLIVPDVEDVYTPLHSEIVVQLYKCRQHLEQLVKNIPAIFETNRISESAFGAAIKASFLALKPTGGKLLVFQSVLPTVGIGALDVREAEGRSNVSTSGEEAKKWLQPRDDTLKTMALEFAEHQVCVDVFVTSQHYVDIASISVVPRNTGGKVYQYYPFHAPSDSMKLYNDLRWNITRPQGFEAVMHISCSQGLQVHDYYGSFYKRNPPDIDLPAIDCDKSFLVTLKHDGTLLEGTDCSFQCTLLYTTVYGQRRIRVINQSLSTTKRLSHLFKSADMDTLIACFIKQALYGIQSNSLSRVREQMINFCINILYSYRKFCVSPPSSGSLILPESLKFLPLYTLALIKSVGLRSEGRPDDRSYWINHAVSLSTALTIPLVYPRLLAVLDLTSKEHNGSIISSPIPLSIGQISDDGIYLLENGEDALIYVGSTVDPDTLCQVFGSPTIEHITNSFMLEKYDNEISRKLNDVLNEIRRQRCSLLRLRLCRKGDPSGELFFSYMIEDKTPGELSYVEFLAHIHQQIQERMA